MKDSYKKETWIFFHDEWNKKDNDDSKFQDGVDDVQDHPSNKRNETRKSILGIR